MHEYAHTDKIIIEYLLGKIKLLECRQIIEIHLINLLFFMIASTYACGRGAAASRGGMASASRGEGGCGFSRRLGCEGVAAVTDKMVHKNSSFAGE